MADDPGSLMQRNINDMMKPMNEMDAIRLEPVVWIDSEALDAIHADREEATSLDPADTVHIPDVPPAPVHDPADTPDDAGGNEPQYD